MASIVEGVIPGALPGALERVHSSSPVKGTASPDQNRDGIVGCVPGAPTTASAFIPHPSSFQSPIRNLRSLAAPRASDRPSRY